MTVNCSSDIRLIVTCSLKKYVYGIFRNRVMFPSDCSGNGKDRIFVCPYQIVIRKGDFLIQKGGNFFVFFGKSYFQKSSYFTKVESVHGLSRFHHNKVC